MEISSTTFLKSGGQGITSRQFQTFTRSEMDEKTAVAKKLTNARVNGWQISWSRPAEPLPESRAPPTKPSEAVIEK